MFPAAYMDHFENPRCQGTLVDATHTAMREDPACGDRLWLDLRVRDGHIEAARYRVQGCSGSIAAASAMAELLEGRALSNLVTSADLDSALGGIPSGKRHALRLATKTLADALAGPSTSNEGV